MRIHIFHTNDIHSALENHIRLGHQLREERARCLAHKESVLTLDIGDALDRVRPETDVTLGRVNAGIMRALEYDAWVFGNNEGLTVPPNEWGELTSLCGAAWLSTNLRMANGRSFPFGHDHMIVLFGDVKVGLFGVTENYTLPYSVLDLLVLDPIETAIQTTRHLKASGCDIVIALSHLGLWKDRQLAAQVDELDVILGGHSHHFMDEPERMSGTTVFQAGKHGLAFGHTILDFDPQNRVLRDVQCASVRVDLHGPSDERMLSALHEMEPEYQRKLSQVSVSLEAHLPTKLDQESQLANVLADALFYAYDPDIVMMMSGALTASLLAGPITVRDILGACSTPTRPIGLTLTGREIEAILNKSIQEDGYGRAGFGYGFRGSVIGYMALSNASVQLIRSKDGVPKIQEISIGGRPLMLDYDYRVTTCEFLWLSPAYPEFQAGRDVVFEKPLVREVFLRYLAEQKFADESNQPRFLYT